MLRVVHLTQRFPPAIGGVERHVYEISKRLAPKYEVDVFTSDLAKDRPFTGRLSLDVQRNSGKGSKLPPTRRFGTFSSHPVPGLVHLDIRNAEETYQLVREVSPSVIFQPAALPNVDWCEEHPEECWATNVWGTANLVRAARESRAKFVYFSSDYVFDGENGPYTEDDEPRPINVYGEAKLAAESLVQGLLRIIETARRYDWRSCRKSQSDLSNGGRLASLCKNLCSLLPIAGCGNHWQKT